MNHRESTLKALAEKGAKASTLNAFVGLDGFVDKLMTLVSSRHGTGEHFDAIPNITQFGERILAAANKSTNIEMYPKLEKLGGNGPIMANALLQTGLNTKYLGALGYPDVHPVFKDFADASNAISIVEPGVTHALEFDDGKIMLGTTASLDAISYARIVEIMGEGAFMDTLSRADLIALVNWTMIPNMTSIFNELLDKALPNLGPRDHRHFFFDLADPEKRTDSDILGVIQTIKRFQNYGSVTLGLNLKEGQHVYRLLGHSATTEDADGLKRMCTTIRNELEISCVVIHPTSSAACATRDDAWHIDGPFCEKPMITTGAGDHFNAGFMTGMTLGLQPIECLTVAVSCSGSYVRTAKSPTLNEIDSFLNSWQ